jgi:type II secretory pathway pseudopilin PulG
MKQRRKLTAMLWARRFRNDRRGSTLIEVIVSVLIVGIAFVPLMVGLNAALKVNKQTENNLNAENVAVNIIEVCKTYGTKGFAKLKADEDIDSTTGITTVFTGASLEFNDPDPITYTINGIKSGTNDREYSARIVFEDIDENQNDFSGYASVDSLEKAIVVNLADDSFDYVINQFVAQANATGVAEDNVDALSVEDMKKSSNVPKWLSREIHISIVEDEGKVKVTRKIVYIANNNTIDGKYPFRTSSYTPTPVITQPDTKEYVEVPEMAVLNYKQFKDKEKKDLNLDNGHGDKIIIDKAVTGAMKVIALSENGQTLKNKGYNLYFDAHDSVDDLTHVYSNLNFMGTYCEEDPSFGSADEKNTTIMRNITITVSDDRGEVVATKKSTLIDAK